MTKEFRLKNYPSIVPALEECFRSLEPGNVGTPLLCLWFNEKTREFSAHEANFEEKDTYEVCSLGTICSIMGMHDSAVKVNVKQCAEDILDLLYYHDDTDEVAEGTQIREVLGTLCDFLESPCISYDGKRKVESAIELLGEVKEEIEKLVEEIS